jgi:hypothetical protein
VKMLVAEPLDAAADRSYGGRSHLVIYNGVLSEGPINRFADERALGSDLLAQANEIPERTHVPFRLGVDFGAAGQGRLRFCSPAFESPIEAAPSRLSCVLTEVA